MVGVGSHSRVWRAVDTQVRGRSVALKQCTEQLRQRAELEVAYARRLRDEPNILVPEQLVAEHGSLWLVEEYLEGCDLAYLLAECGPLEPTEVAWIGAQVAEALAAAHSSGLVHRDVAPGNILVARGGDVAKLSDFGVARRLEGDLGVTADGALVGTPLYLSPEEALGAMASEASDVYALGAVLYHAVEGGPPVGDADRGRLLDMIRAGQVRPAERAGPLQPLLAQMMLRSPQSRPSAEDVAEALYDLDGSLTESTRAVLNERRVPRERLATPRARRPPLRITAILALLLAVVLGTWLVVERLKPVGSATDTPPAGPTPPPSEVVYAVYSSANVDDLQLGAPPMVLRSTGTDPRPEYREIELVGKGPRVDPDPLIPGTHPVYDYFCTGRGNPAPCSGVLRSHYLTTAAVPPRFWQRPPSVLGPMARLYNVDITGTCRPGTVAVYRFENADQSQPRWFRLGTTSPGPGWTPAENLGCARR